MSDSYEINPKCNAEAINFKAPKKIGIFAGSFDPYTLGHLYITETACKIFDKVIVCIATNSAKRRMFSKEMMKLGIEETLVNRNIINFEVICEPLFIPSPQECSENQYFIIRGLRNAFDLDYEFKIAENFFKEYDLETIYIGSGEAQGIVPGTCSTKVRECLKNGECISQYVSREIEDIISYYDYLK